jgi:hypothetical protein
VIDWERAFSRAATTDYIPGRRSDRDDRSQSHSDGSFLVKKVAEVAADDLTVPVWTLVE